MNIKEWEVNKLPTFFIKRAEMFELNGKMKFININQNYIKELNKICSEVYYKENGYDNKPYVGILVNKENKSYVIPLSSAKDKHKSWKNVNQDCYLVYEYSLKTKMGDSDIWVQEKNEEKRIDYIITK